MASRGPEKKAVKKRPKRPIKREKGGPRPLHLHPTTWDGLLSSCTYDVRRLDNVVRFSSIPVTYSETTASHSFWVTLFSLLIWKALRDGGVKVPDLVDVLHHAVSHDVGEAVTGDIVRTMKYASPEMKAAVDRSESELAQKLFTPDLLSALSLSPKPYVKAIVKAADFMSLWQFMRREAARSNYEIIPYYRRMIRDLEEQSVTAHTSVRGLYEAMVEEAHSVSENCFGNLAGDPRWVRSV